MVLTRAGYAVLAVANAPQAIAAFQAESFDLVLSDVMMPGMNGHELAHWVALNHPMTPVALMTACDATAGQGNSSSPHCRMLAKPFLPEDLVSFLEGVLAEGPAQGLRSAL
jgi:two-component system cell cycle response regulator CpdR